MSETFLIKKTTFNSNSTDLIESSTNSFLIGPGELNGPGGQNRSSELRLYGLGSLKWGEGVNENLYRLLENHACPRKETDDYNPASGLFDYNQATDPILPKDENDLGKGNGITTPIVGQAWFNMDDSLDYTWTGTGWKTILNPDGSLTLAGILDMNTYGIINMAAPRFAPIDPLPTPSAFREDAVNVWWADDRYINRTGDSMTGVLDMNDNKVTNIPPPTVAKDAVSLIYADENYVRRDGSLNTATGNAGMFANLSMNGNKITNLSLPDQNEGYPSRKLNAMNVWYGDLTFLSQGTSLLSVDDTKYGNLTLADGNLTLGDGNLYVQNGFATFSKHINMFDNIIMKKSGLGGAPDIRYNPKLFFDSYYALGHRPSIYNYELTEDYADLRISLSQRTGGFANLDIGTTPTSSEANWTSAATISRDGLLTCNTMEVGPDHNSWSPIINLGANNEGTGRSHFIGFTDGNSANGLSTTRRFGWKTDGGGVQQGEFQLEDFHGNFHTVYHTANLPSAAINTATQTKFYSYPSRIYRLEYSNKTEKQNTIKTATLTYANIIPSSAQYVLLRFKMGSEYITDLRTYWVYMNSVMVAAMGSDDTDQGGRQHSYGISEVWVRASARSLAWHAASRSSTMRLEVYIVGYAYNNAGI